MRRSLNTPRFSMEEDWFGCIVGLAILLLAELLVRVGL